MVNILGIESGVRLENHREGRREDRISFATHEIPVGGVQAGFNGESERLKFLEDRHQKHSFMQRQIICNGCYGGRGHKIFVKDIEDRSLDLQSLVKIPEY